MSTPIDGTAVTSLGSDDRGFFGHPWGLSTLFFTEMWERFSYYGMRALLTLYMTSKAIDGGLGFDERYASAIYATYVSSVWYLPLVGGWLAVCVLGPVLATRLDLRWVATTCAVIVCFTATADLLHQPRSTAISQFPTEQDAAAITQFANDHGATTGYAGYWDAAAITWHSRFELRLYPIQECPPPLVGGRNCPFTLHVISSWYDTIPEPTVLVIDTLQPLQPVVDPGYGPPTATAQFGRYTVRVYPHHAIPQWEIPQSTATVP